MRTLYFLSFALLLLVWSCQVFAEPPLAGTSGTFMRLAGDPLEASLGMTTITRLGDPLVLDRNPAGIATVRQITGATGFGLLAMTRQSYYAAAAFPIAKGAVLGARWRSENTTRLERRDLFGNGLGHLANSDNLVAVALAKPITKEWFAGAGVEYAEKNIDGLHAYGVAANLGITWRPQPEWTMAAAVSNLGMRYRWDATGYYTDGSVYDDNWPLDTRFGLSWKPLPWLSGYGELSGLWGWDRNEARWGFGVESFLEEILFVRAGIYRTYAITYWGIGLGLQMHLKGLRLGLDYSISPGVMGTGMEQRTGLSIQVDE